MFKQKTNNKKGFTLAEVLVTLAVIGVVAAMTIPGLMNNTNEKDLDVSYKKLCSTLFNATNILFSENGGSLIGVCPAINYQYDAKCFLGVYKTILSISNYCDSNGIGEGCWHPQGTIKTSSGTPYTSPVTYYGMTLNDGTLLYFLYGNGSCTTTSGSVNNVCSHIYVDVNGFRGPNTWGKDIFAFYVTKDRLVPRE